MEWGYEGELGWYLTCFVAVSLMWWVVDDDGDDVVDDGMVMMLLMMDDDQEMARVLVIVEMQCHVNELT